MFAGGFAIPNSIETMRRRAWITALVRTLSQHRLVVAIVTLGVAVDATWKDCELAARSPDRSIAACSK
jgi:hypothetical protein